MTKCMGMEYSHGPQDNNFKEPTSKVTNTGKER